MAASPNYSYRVRDEIDEVYSFPVEGERTGYHLEQAFILVRYRGGGRADVILKDMPGRQGYYIDYPGAVEGDEEKERENELAHELVEYAEMALDRYGPKLSHWKANSGNRSLRDIYVEVEAEKVNEVIVSMYQILVRAKAKRLQFLEEYRPEKVEEPDSTVQEKVEEIIGQASANLILSDELEHGS